MKLLKQSEQSKLFRIEGLSDDTLIALYNVCLNYKAYLSQITSLPNATLLQIAPGSSAKEVRRNLAEQEKACDDYINMWNDIIQSGGTNKLKN